MSIRLSDRVSRVRLSPNAAANQRVKELKRAGRDIINLTIGEPDFDTPAHIKEAAYAALQRGETKYPPTGGILALRQAVAEGLANRHGLAYGLEQIIIGNGAKQVIANAFAATLRPGDQVIIPAPYWPSFPDAALYNDGTPVFVACGEAEGFKLAPAALAQAITPDTRWLVLNSPSNPTGADYQGAELAALAQVLRAHPDVLLLLDEVYENIRFTADPPHLLAVAPDLQDRVLIVNAASKTYAMTGWRLGWGAGPAELVKAMTVVQSQFTAGSATVSQHAGLAALAGPQDFVETSRVAYRQRRDIVCQALDAIDGFTLAWPDGSFFAFPGAHALIGRIRPDGRTIASDEDLTEYLLEDGGVAVMPGSVFGLSGHIRLAFAIDQATLIEAMGRIDQAVARLSHGPAGREIVQTLRPK